MCETLKAMDRLATLFITVLGGPSQDDKYLALRRARQERPTPTPETRLLDQLDGVKASKQCIVQVAWPPAVVGDSPGPYSFELRTKRGALDETVHESVPLLS